MGFFQILLRLGEAVMTTLLIRCGVKDRPQFRILSPNGTASSTQGGGPSFEVKIACHIG